jgi:hypothetical protein
VPHNIHSIHISNDLMPKTSAEQWNFASNRPHYLSADTGRSWGTRTGRQHHMSWGHLYDIHCRHFVMTHDANVDRWIDDANAVNEIPCKGVVVVDEQ